MFDGNGNLIESLDAVGHASCSARTSSRSAPTIREKHVWIVDDHKPRHLQVHQRRQDASCRPSARYDVAGRRRHAFQPADLSSTGSPTARFVRRRRLQRHARRQVRQGRQVPDGVGREGHAAERHAPGYFNNVHGIAVDPQTRQVFVNDRGNHRVAGVRRERQVPRRVELRRRSRPTSTCSTSSRDRLCCGPPIAARRKMLKYDLERPLPVLVGHVGRFPRRLLGRARLQRRSGRQFLRRRSRQRRRAEVPSAPGREPRDPDRQAASRRLEIEHSE